MLNVGLTFCCLAKGISSQNEFVLKLEKNRKLICELKFKILGRKGHSDFFFFPCELFLEHLQNSQYFPSLTFAIKGIICSYRRATVMQLANLGPSELKVLQKSISEKEKEVLGMPMFVAASE